MKSKKEKYNLTFAIAFEILLLITAIVNFINGVKRNGYLSIMSMFLIPVPFILSNLADKKDIRLPSSFKVIAILFLFGTQYLGELVGFYFTLWWWDIFLHGFAGFYMVSVGRDLIKSFIINEKGINSNRYAFFISLWAFSFSTTISTLWEIFQYIGDSLLNTNMLKEGIKDTFHDLLAGELLALLGAIVIYLKLRYKKAALYKV